MSGQGTQVRTRTRERALRYLIPTLIGMGGLLFSKQVDNAVLRFTIVLLSVAVPLFAGGNLLARYGSQGRVRYILLTGVVFLLLGAAASFSDFGDFAGEQRLFSQSVADISRWLGMCSLLLGLFVVLISMVRTGEAIEEVGERFRHLADLMSEGFILSSPDGMIVLVNQRFLDMLGLTEDEVLGENAGKLVDRLKVDSMAPHLDMRARGIASEYEIAWQVRGEERQFWISGTPIFNHRGRHAGTLATVRDVTERNRMAKRLERYAKGLQDLVEEQTQKLRHSEQEFRDLLLHMNEGFLTIDASYRIQFANNRICEMLGVSPQTIRGCEVFDFVDAPGRVKLMERLRTEGAAEEAGPQGEYDFVRADGSLVSVMVAVAPVHDPGEEGTRYSLVVTNVSELKQMQRQLEMRANELEAANEELRAHGRAKDGFLSNVSHELKTPLSTIHGYVEMLESGSLGDLAAPQVSALKVMGRNVKRLVGLINEMIEFSRMEIRGIQLKTTLFSPAKLVRECVASVQPQALAKDLSMSIFVPDTFPSAWADREKIGQVLGILLSNAVKFSQEGGMIQIRVSEQPDHTLAIAVSDTGIGIDPAYHARVFDKFFQVDGSMTRRYEGAGIGLSIAKSIIEAHAGRIDLESEPNKGSTFTIVLPRAVFDAAVAPADQQGLGGVHALIVAEGETFRRTMREVLTRCGCAVTEAGNGYECVRLAHETAPDVILFNEVLSDVGGISAIASLRQDGAAQEIPVVILSGEDPLQIQAAIGMASEVHFLKKPFSAEELVWCMRRVCLDEAPHDREYRPAAVEGERQVLIVDPDTDLLEWLETALRRRNIVCWTATGPGAGLDATERHAPDVIFVDIDAPDSASKTLGMFRSSKAAHNVPICVMAGMMPAGRAMPEGAAAALKKPFSVEEFVRIVEELSPAAV